MKRIREFFLTLPSLGWLIFFFLFPACIVYTFVFRVHDPEGSVLSEWTTSALQSLEDLNILKIAWRTICLSSLTMAFSVAIAIPISYCMAASSKKAQGRLLLLIVVPFWSCFLVRIFAWKTLLHPEGLLKGICVTLGLMNEDSSLLYHNATVLVVMIYSYLPFAILPLYSSASKFNFSLLEAARDLGATKLRAFFSIFIPYLTPAICTSCLMVLIPAAGAYVIPDIVGGHNSEMLGNKIAQRVFVDRNLPEASALSALLSFIILIPALLVTMYKSSKRERKSCS